MPPSPVPARLHILTARTKPVAVVLRRGPTDWFHVLRWDTRTDAVEHGSWFRGTLYPFRCDLSDDGRHMVYLAMGEKGETWNGVCEPPWLRTLVHWSNEGTWFGGGLWLSGRRLAVNVGHGVPMNPEGEFTLVYPEPITLPFDLVSQPFPAGGEDEGVLYRRLERDGWVRRGPFGEDVKLPGNNYRVEHRGDAGWEINRGNRLPTLHLYYRGYFGGEGRRFEFQCAEFPGVITPGIRWAAWDCRDQLLVARTGRIERWTREDFKRAEPSFTMDLNGLEPQSTPGIDGEPRASAGTRAPSPGDA